MKTRNRAIILSLAALAAACGGQRGDDESSPASTSVDDTTTSVDDTTTTVGAATTTEGTAAVASTPGTEVTTTEAEATTTEAEATTTTEAAPASLIDLADCPADYNPIEGVTEDEIRFASSVPQSGPAGTFNFIASGIRSYFNYYNATKGGYEGRNLVLDIKDDVYEPNRTLENVEEFLGSDQRPFAFLGMIGTPNNLFVWDKINEACIPHLYVLTGAAEWGADIPTHPWSVGVLPVYQLEVGVFLDYLVEQNPGVKTLALLYQNDDYGESYRMGLEKAAAEHGLEIVATETHERGETIIDIQINNLAESGADVFIGGITGDACTNAIRAIGESAWDPILYISQTCTSKNFLDAAGPDGATGADKHAADVYSVTYIQDPSNPAFASSPGMSEYLANVEVYKDPNMPMLPNVGITAVGWQIGELVAATLESAGELSRPAIMDAARSLDFDGSMLLDGVSFQTGGTADPYALEQFSVVQYDGTNYKYSEIRDYEGRTLDFVDVDDLALE